MSRAIGRRRYLTNFEPHRVPHLFTDVLIIGSGVAGLRAAIEAARAGCDVLVITKDEAAQSATRWAQGGIAAAAPAPDSPEAHAQDTLNAACGLADEAVVRGVVAEAAECIAELQHFGVQFDQDGGGLAMGREGAHSAARIMHAHGDATGWEIVRALLEAVRREPRVRVFEKCFAIDLLSENGEVVGAVTHHHKYGHQMFWSTVTVLAGGGASRAYRETTTPPVATGDAMAMALRAGAALRDMEMVQFHPTTLYVAGAARALISEAVRGEGGHLVNRAGERFMERYDPRGELASRDIVSRAIAAEMRRTQAASVYLDVRHFAPGRFAERFPSIYRLCRDFDLDPAADLIPVRPAAHYTIGGVAIDETGRTGMGRLLACGEATSSGLHGANRLASNSLLEGAVYGRRVGRLASELASKTRRPARPLAISSLIPPSSRTELDLADVLHSLQSVMSRNVGIERDGDRLRETAEIIEFWSRYVMDKVFDEPAAWETQNLLTIALATTLAAQARAESRGCHFRTDFPHPDPHWVRHIEVRRSEEGLTLSTTAGPEVLRSEPRA